MTSTLNLTVAVAAILSALHSVQIEAAPQGWLSLDNDRHEILRRPLVNPLGLDTVQVQSVGVAELTAFLHDHLPGLWQAAVELATPPFAFHEVTRLSQAVSDAVRVGLPQLKGVEARALVVVLARYLWREAAAPRLSPTLRPWTGLLEQLLITGIEVAYQLTIKRR